MTLSRNKKETVAANEIQGTVVGQLLQSAWRAQPSSPTTSARELDEISMLVLKSGAAALAWNKVRNSKLARCKAGRQFRQAYLRDSMQAAVNQYHLKRVVPLLRSAGVEPIVVKGWAVARLYPEPGFRPYCDLDVCVTPKNYSTARAALQGAKTEVAVDLHAGFEKFYDRKTEDILGRSELVKLDDVEVRVLGAEDNLRFLCLHLLRHGVNRPIWLCDIGVLVENRSADFDWDLCLTGSRRELDWITCALALGHELLGIDLKGTPLERHPKALPKWLVPAVLKEWGRPYHSRRQVAGYLRYPIGILRDLALHWPNAIEATMTVHGPFNDLPRLPFQVGHLVSRTTALIAEVAERPGKA